MFKFLQKSPKDELKKILGDYALPSFPGVALEVMGKVRDSDATASDIAEILGTDPALSVKVLQMANSATFSPRKEVENIGHAITMIGLSSLETLVLTSAAGATMPRDSKPGYDFTRFWTMACYRGVVARSLASKLCPSQSNECFLAGFLQDLAIPFLASTRSDTYGPILERWHNEPDSSLAALEREAFDWDHAEVATWILEDWKLPESLASAIGGHHGADNTLYDCPPPVALAGCLREEEREAGETALVNDAVARFGLQEAEVRELLETSFDQAGAMARSML